MNNQSSGYDLYVHFPILLHNSLTISAQCLTTCANVMAATRHFVALSSVSCMARYKRKFVLPASPIIENLCRCDKALCTICKGKGVLYGRSYNDEWFLDSGVMTLLDSPGLSAIDQQWLDSLWNEEMMTLASLTHTP